MKYLIVFFLGVSSAHCAEIYLDENKKAMTKIDAVKSFLKDRSSKIMRCYDVELTDKLTLRKRKTKEQ